MKYIPKNKISKPRPALQSEFALAKSGLVYSGEVVETADKKYFAYENGALNYDKPLIRKIRDAATPHALGPKNSLPRTDMYFKYTTQKGSNLSYTEEIPKANYVLTSRNYEHGSFKRYFVKNKNTQEVFEIGPKAYIALQSKTTYYHWPSYQIVEFDWKIAGDVADKEISGYLVEGVETINKKAVEEASKTIPEIKNILTDYLEYHK